jgi:adenylylsulfate kinase
MRQYYNDWDFSYEGRIRQAHRMRQHADDCTANFVIADFVCPLKEMREIFDAYKIIWMDTISQGRYEDTNKIFVQPVQVDYHVTDWNQTWVEHIANNLINDHSN